MNNLEFVMIQNINNEYPELPGEVLLYVSNNERQGYSHCNEYGETNFLPGAPLYLQERWFFAANEETIWAFLGEKKIEFSKDNKQQYTLLKVVYKYEGMENNATNR